MRTGALVLAFCCALAGGCIHRSAITPAVDRHGELPVPVMVGNDHDLDACAAWGEARPDAPAGAGTLAVRNRPSQAGAVVYRLREAQGFWICDESPGGNWTGIVIEHNPVLGHLDGDPQCGVGSPIRPRQPYRGPCISGWVRSEHVLLVAG